MGEEGEEKGLTAAGSGVADAAWQAATRPDLAPPGYVPPLDIGIVAGRGQSGKRERVLWGVGRAVGRRTGREG